MKKENGITLIALVITIIVLLILAGISISMLVGDNGILNQATSSKVQTEIGKEKEIIQLALAEISTLNDGKLLITEENLKKALGNFGGDNVSIEVSESIFIITFLESGRKYDVQSDGVVENIIEDTTIDSIAQESETIYLLQSIEDLVILSNNVANGNTYEGITFKLQRNLNFKSESSYINPKSTIFGDVNGNHVVEELMTELTTGNGFKPIGDYGKIFSGNIEGNNHRISNLYVCWSDTRTGFIGRGANNTIQNLILENVCIGNNQNYASAALMGLLESGYLVVDNCQISGKVINSYYSASILGEAYSGSNAQIKVTNCVNDAIIQGKYCAGGIIAKPYNPTVIQIENCVNNGSVTSSSGDASGILATTYEFSENITIKKCSNNATITSNGTNTGGIIGDTFGKSGANNSLVIEECTNMGNIVSTYSYSGGIVGRIYSVYTSSITNCSNNAIIGISGNTASYVGGIIGRAEKSTQISLCSNLSNVYGGGYIGGILGSCEGSDTNDFFIEKSYNLGDIVGTYNTGGILGNKPYTGANVPITYCYNKGKITQNTETSTSGSYFGGIIGNGNCDIKNCYNLGEIEATNAYSIGGICGGEEHVTLENTYNLGKITASTKSNIGGVAGIVKTISNSYNGGIINIATGQNYIASVVGYCYNVDGLSTCYYLKDTFNVGYGYGTDTTNIIENETELKEMINSNLLIIDGWKEDSNNINNGYPIFDWME